VIEARRLAIGIVLATLALIVLLAVRPVSRETILAGYVITLASVALAALTRIMRAARSGGTSRFEHELARKQIPPSRPNALVRIERELTLACSNAGNVHDRLRPMLREIAQARLGVDLQRRADVARARLGGETWELIRPDATPPHDRSAQGLSLRVIRRVIETLERA
jgi:hypothetical protein